MQVFLLLQLKIHQMNDRCLMYCLNASVFAAVMQLLQPCCPVTEALVLIYRGSNVGVAVYSLQPDM